MSVIEQEVAKTESLVPPRPNLGPEPWPEASSWRTSLPVWGLVLALLMVPMVAWWRRKRRKFGTADPAGALNLSTDVDPSPRQRLIASSEKIRDALIEEFGPAWGSKTTEEIIEDLRLTGRLGPEEVLPLVEFLRLSDRAKFARNDPETLHDWESWAESFILGLAGSRS